jgi:hypothetical protein
MDPSEVQRILVRAKIEAAQSSVQLEIIEHLRRDMNKIYEKALISILYEKKKSKKDLRNFAREALNKATTRRIATAKVLNEGVEEK